MADTRRSQSSLATLFGDNTSGDISAQDGRDLIISAHPEEVIQSGAYASEPSSNQLTGDLYWPSDSFYAERYSGSAWAPWGPIFPLTKPVSGDFSWVNQQTGSIATTNGGIVLTGIPVSGSNSLQARVKSAPSTPYHITIAFLFPSANAAGNAQIAGACWRQSSDGKLVTAGVQFTGVSKLAVFSWSSPTAFNASYANPTFNGTTPYWIRISDDGTNRKTEVSADGQTWVLVHSVGRTDYLTANEVGFFVTDSTNVAPVMTLLSWKEN